MAYGSGQSESSNGTIFRSTAMTTREALKLLLDHVDYTTGACRGSDNVEAVLTEEVIAECRQALNDPVNADR